MIRFLRENRKAILKYLAMAIVGSISIFATLIINNKCNEINERDYVRDLVKKAFTDIYETRQNQISFTIMISNQLSENNHWKKKLYPSISQPQIFRDIFKSEIVLSLVDQESLESVRQFNKNSNVLLSALDVDSLDNTKTFGWLYNYGVELWRIEEILNLTIQFLDNRITKEELKLQKFSIMKLYFDGLNKYSKAPFNHPWMKVGE